MSTYSHHRDPDSLGFFVRRIDQHWHVTATGGGLEHTHEHAFDDRAEAYELRDRIRAACEHTGRDLHLAHWDTVALD